MTIPSPTDGLMDASRFAASLAGSPLFGGVISAAATAGINAIVNGFRSRYPAGDSRWLAYMLATAYHETDKTMQPIREYGSDERLARLYDVKGSDPARARRMGNTQPGDGVRYAGRGLVQLTWKNNYALASRKLGVDLVSEPDRALEMATAVDVLVMGMVEGWFTGARLGAYLTATATDWTNARRTVNGTDKAEEIAGYARAFAAAISAAEGEPCTGGKSTVVTTARLNLRQAPVNGGVMRTLPSGQPVTILDQWCLISVDGAKGWVSAAYLTAK